MRSERERLTHTNTHTHIHTHAHQVVFNENSTVAGPVKMAGLAAKKLFTLGHSGALGSYRLGSGATVLGSVCIRRILSSTVSVSA